MCIIRAHFENESRKNPDSSHHCVVFLVPINCYPGFPEKKQPGQHLRNHNLWIQNTWSSSHLLYTTICECSNISPFRHLFSQHGFFRYACPPQKRNLAIETINPMLCVVSNMECSSTKVMPVTSQHEPL